MSITNKRESYFKDILVDEKIALQWKKDRELLASEGYTPQEETLENYKVYEQVYKLRNRIEKIKEHTHTEGGLYVGETASRQTSPTDEEEQIIEIIFREVLKTNYNWRQVKEILRKRSDFKLYANREFPHNTEEIRDLFDPRVRVFHLSFEGDENSCSHAASLVRERAKAFANGLNFEKIREIFKTKSNDHIDDYLKRMILSQYDIPRIVSKSNGNYRESLKRVADELSKGTEFSPETIEILFGDEDNNRSLAAIAQGTMLSLTTEEEIGNIYKQCKDTQHDLSCWKGTITNSDINSITLPDGNVIYSIHCCDIEPKYNSLRNHYSFSYRNASDLEFVEDSVDVMGDVMMHQAFRDGNKRTAKCLFNSMLMSRGIVPPVVDLNQDGNDLWFKFVDGRNSGYPEAKIEILEATTDVAKQFETAIQSQKKSFIQPLKVSERDCDRKLMQR